ncbi:DUF732 domain-containing protein [Mycobacterium sp. Aquia_213]|uniref:DUF732 domain-containing protein n=1 Tax=Mycobacterium sp. Aquia_213 TaxID=2991728 RepID=UPI002270BAF0|nr:DUF732 domain-containing protein [Mycobacterium sp. Aquia_213]WAC90246.1 DUF732 domain-containing protein [Mycobacterium sp. Aquia_213]
MSEPVPATDKTVGLDGSETVAAPTSVEPEAATSTNSAGLAWSRGDDDVDTPSDAPNQRQSWRATWRTAAALLAVGLVIAGAIVLGRSLLTTHPKPSAPSPTAAPTSKAAPAPGTASTAAPSSIVSTPGQDNKYVQDLNDQGISFANPDAAIYNGKMVCANIRLGMTVQQIIADFRATNPALGSHAETYVTISVHAYCPQNSNLVGSGP